MAAPEQSGSTLFSSVLLPCLFRSALIGASRYIQSLTEVDVRAKTLHCNRVLCDQKDGIHRKLLIFG